jgi:hypothetical protein
MEQGMVTPQSPQYIPSSATQRNAPQRSHFLGSSELYRQTIRRPYPPEEFKLAWDPQGRYMTRARSAARPFRPLGPPGPDLVPQVYC